MATPSHSTVFEKAITVTPISLHTYEAHLDQQWCIGMAPHRGYTTSILYRTASLHFKNKTRNNLQDVKLGARLSTIHVTLSQARSSVDTGELEAKVAAYVTVSPPDAEDGRVVKGVWGLSPPPPTSCLSNGLINYAALIENGKDGSWERYPRPHPALAVAQHVELYGPSSSLSARTREERTKGVVNQWARFKPGGEVARWSNESLMFLVDLFPAVLDRMGMAIEGGPFWYPTVTMNIDLKTRLPLDGMEWLHSRVATRMLRGSRADLEVLILNAKGELVATSSQVALVVDASRNVKGRQGPEKL
ncbi:thioesterase-like superfamily-domain-containing protein [Aspergillus cavernicola]|uniref:Thioesterase-like superfamily-domain-containing protein n=1 Tax=Aspergillus cavernicola TaxID=176166 RepID=A0ABR4H989_9EURO